MMRSRLCVCGHDQRISDAAGKCWEKAGLQRDRVWLHRNDVGVGERHIGRDSEEPKGASRVGVGNFQMRCVGRNSFKFAGWRGSARVRFTAHRRRHDHDERASADTPFKLPLATLTTVLSSFSVLALFRRLRALDTPARFRKPPGALLHPWFHCHPYSNPHPHTC